jgi:hypothetical protein
MPKAKPLPQLTDADIARFLDKITTGGPDDCWPWNGARLPRGYGVFKIRGRMVKASRVSYFLVHGVDPYPNLVLHTCDYPPCNNGAHLFTGTDLDNLQDMAAKGRASRKRGSEQNGALLTDDQVIAIRHRYATERILQQQLAYEYGVTRRTISAIVTLTTWKHLPGADGTANRPSRQRHTN